MANKKLILDGEKTFILLEVSQGYNYARKIIEQRREDNKSELIKIQRNLFILEKEGWLNKEIVQPKNKKIYSLNWDFIIDSFLKYILTKLDKGDLMSIDYLYFRGNLLNMPQKYRLKLKLEMVENLTKFKDKDKLLLKPFIGAIFWYSYQTLKSRKQKVNIEILFTDMIWSLGGNTKLQMGNKFNPQPFILILAICCYEIYRYGQVGIVRHYAGGILNLKSSLFKT